MVIAVNLKSFSKDHQHAYQNLICQCFSRIVEQQPQHTFIFISENASQFSCGVFENVISLIIKPKAGITAFSNFFYRIKISFLLKKYNAAIFVNADGFCSLFTNAQQCFIVHRLDCLLSADVTKKFDFFFYKKFMSLFLKKANKVVTDSAFSKTFIVEKYTVNYKKIKVIYAPASEFFLPLNWEVREKIKAEYANGNEYFILDANLSLLKDPVILLKAFSHFKKWQKSSMQFLIIQSNTLDKDFLKSLQLFKYREDVRILNNLPHDEVAKIIAAAYAMICFSHCGNFQISPADALSYHVPIITSPGGSASEVFADAVLYADPDKPEDIAEKLMIIFKDENLRQQLIQKSKEQAQRFSLDVTSNALWEAIKETSNETN